LKRLDDLDADVAASPLTPDIVDCRLSTRSVVDRSVIEHRACDANSANLERACDGVTIHACERSEGKGKRNNATTQQRRTFSVTVMGQ